MNPLEKTDLKELCIGYMVSAGGLDAIRREYGPSILKVRIIVDCMYLSYRARVSEWIYTL